MTQAAPAAHLARRSVWARLGDWRVGGQRAAVVLLPAIATLVVSVCFGQGMRGTDDLDYADVAIALLGGEGSTPLLAPHYHDARLGVVLPLVASFFVAGTSDFSITVLPLVCTVLTASLIAWLAARSFGRRAGLAAGLLYALIPLPVQLATVCVPEPMLTFALCVATVLFVLASEDRRWSNGLALLAGAMVGVAYLTTEVGALMLPVFYFHRLLVGGLRLRDGWLLAGFVLVFGLELAFHAAVHGDALYRFTLVANYPEDPMGRAANEDLIYRLFKAYPSLFAYPNRDFGLSGPILALGALYACFRLRPNALFLLWAAALLLFYNFMTSSFTHYVALPAASRLIAPACAPLAILSGKLLVDLWEWTGQWRVLAVRRAARTLGVVGGAAVVSVALLSMYLNVSPTLTGAATQNAKAVAGFLRDEPAVTLVSDLLSARAIRFYRGVRSSDSQFGFAAAVRAPMPDAPTPTFVVLNGPILHERELTGGLWGGPLSLPPADRDAVLRFEPGADVEIFRARPREGRWVEWLLRSGAVRALIGPSSTRLTGGLVGDAPLVEVRAFRLASAAPGGVGAARADGSY